MDDLGIIPEYSLYPNPSDSDFNIKLTKSEEKKFHYSIIDIIGSLITEKFIGYIGESTFERKVTIEDLPSGIYVLILRLDNQIFRKKIIVSNESHSY
ncbi:T9SS type A sorting domain-containing protein [Flavobacterium sp. T12S277]|uniref:T9SS type A sorting domain-containing protein n=1 Tax=Flavobacterium sp. T12S277 TaxID=3402752 RepID=UPI003ADD73FE